MANVFGEPDDEGLNMPFKDQNGLYKGNSDINSKSETLNEAIRILKENGKIVILENNTPYGTFAGPSAMVKLLEEKGFQVLDAVNQKDDDWQDLAAEFAKPNEWWSYFSYLVIAQKPE